jgi:hypothetical protein
MLISEAEADPSRQPSFRAVVRAFSEHAKDGKHRAVGCARLGSTWPVISAIEPFAAKIDRNGSV